MEYGLDAAGAKRSFDAAIREDPTREAGVFRDVVTGEHVCAEGGHSFVEVSWMDLPEIRSVAKRAYGTWLRITTRIAG